MAETWLTPVFQVWTEVVGNPPSRPSRVAQALGPLRKDGVLPAEVVAALRCYLQGHKRNNFAFVKLEKFADVWTAWVPRQQRYVPPVRKAAKTAEPPPISATEIRASITELQAQHPHSPYVQTLERLYARVVGKA